MSNPNPYRNNSERRPLSERDMLEAARGRVVRGTNNMRLGLYNYDNTVAVPTGQLVQFSRQFEERPETPVQQATVADVPEVLNNVVDMMGRADQRQQTERELRIAEAERVANEAYGDEIAA